MIGKAAVAFGRWRVVVGVVLVAAIVVGLWFAGDAGDVATVGAWRDRLIGVVGSWPLVSAVVAGLFYTVVCALSVPIAGPLSLLVGALFGLWWGVAITSLASTLGATLAMLLGRSLGRGPLEALLGKYLQRFDQAFDQHAASTLFALRLAPVVPFWVINLGMGLTSIRVRTYIWVSWLGMLPGTIVYILAGTRLATIDQPGDLLDLPLLLSLVLLALLPITLSLAVRWWRAEHRPPVWRRALTLGLAACLLVTAAALPLALPASTPPLPPPPQADANDPPAPLVVRNGVAYYQTSAEDLLATTLQRVVNDEGLVNYAALAKDHAALSRWYASIAHLDPQTLASWSEAEQLAFWINAYNGLTLLIVSQHYPPTPTLYGRAQDWFTPAHIPELSIRNIPWVWTGIGFRVAGRALTLDQIEHRIIRPTFNEPRIHFALNCASMGCPRLRREPYTGPRLDVQLDEQTRHALNHHPGNRVTIDRSTTTVTLSWLFEAFSQDFAPPGTARDRALMDFIAPYLPDPDATWLRANQPTLQFRTFDWGLNRQ